MKRVNDHIRDRLLSGVVSSQIGDKAESLESLSRTEWCPEFEQLMRNRLLMGRYRYGSMSTSRDREHRWIESAVRRLETYLKTGNLEHLVDVANLCLVEYQFSSHPDRHFDAADSTEEHAEKK